MFQPSLSPPQAKFRSYANVRKDLKELGESIITHTKEKIPLVASPISNLLSQKENADLYSGWQCATNFTLMFIFPAIYQARHCCKTKPKHGP